MNKFVLLSGVLWCGLYAAADSAAPLFETRNIFEPKPLHSHGSSIVQCPNGDLLACWFHGSGERSADDVKVQGARLRAGADAWGPVFTMADTPGFPDCNPVLFIDAQDRLWLFWIAVQAHRWECSLLKYRRAESYQDAGPPRWSWQDVIQLKPGDGFPAAIKEDFKALEFDQDMWAEYAEPYDELIVRAAHDPMKRQMGWMTRIHPLELPSGRILLPLYSDGFNVSLAAISDDAGETWRAAARPIVGFGPIQPSFVRKQDGTIGAFMRDSGNAPFRVMYSESKDDGETWTPARDIETPNPGSSLEVIRLASGRWLMICNDTDYGRGQLSAWVSDDEGATWRWRRRLEPCDDAGTSFSYPSVIQTRDGAIDMTYSYKTAAGACIRHCRINEAWALAGE